MFHNNYIGIYEDRSDGDFDLRAVISPESLDRRSLPILLFWMAQLLDISDGIVVAHPACNFPDVWDGTAINADDIQSFSLPQDGTVQIWKANDVPTVYGMFPPQQAFDDAPDLFTPEQPEVEGVKLP